VVRETGRSAGPGPAPDDVAAEVRRQLGERPRWLRVLEGARPDGETRAPPAPSAIEAARAIRLVADELDELARAYPAAFDERSLARLVEDVLFYLHVRGDLDLWETPDAGPRGLLPGHATLLALADAALYAALERLGRRGRGRPAVERLGAEEHPDELNNLFGDDLAPGPRSLSFAVEACGEERRFCVAAGFVEYVAARVRRAQPDALSYRQRLPVSYADYTLATEAGGRRPRGGRRFQLVLNGLLGLIRRRRVYDCLPRPPVVPTTAPSDDQPLRTMLEGQPIDRQVALLAHWLVRRLALQRRADVSATLRVLRLAIDMLASARDELVDEEPGLADFLPHSESDPEEANERNLERTEEILARLSSGSPRRRGPAGGESRQSRHPSSTYERRRRALLLLIGRRIQVANRHLESASSRFGAATKADLIERAESVMRAGASPTAAADVTRILTLVRALSDEMPTRSVLEEWLVAAVERVTGQRPSPGQAGNRAILAQPHRLDVAHAHVVGALRGFADLRVAEARLAQSASQGR
jgi:hypothetical protein